MTIVRTYYFYSMSEKAGIDYRSEDIEKIGFTDCLEGRLSEANGTYTAYPLVYNWVFSFRTSRIKELDVKMKKILLERRIVDSQGQEWYRKDIDVPSYRIIRDFLDSEDIESKFEDMCSDIKPKRRGRKLKYIAEKIDNFTVLRSNQEEALEFLNENDRATISQPAGTGKTMIYGVFIKDRFVKEERWLILVPTVELVTQVVRFMISLGLPTYSYQDKPDSEDSFILVSTYQSSKKFENISFTGIIYDECHRIVIGTKNRYSSFQHVVKNFKAEYNYFFTATLKFLDASENQISMDQEGYFGKRFEYSYNKAIENGYICDYVARFLSRSKENLVGIFSDNYFYPNKTIIFCNTIEECEQNLEILRNNLEGYSVVTYHSKLTMRKRRKAMKKFKNKSKCILISCDMVSQGFDQPDIDCVIHYSVTSSPIEHTQRNGRGNRRHPSKRLVRIFYLVSNMYQIKETLNLLSASDQRIKLNETIPTVVKNRNCGGGRIAYEIDDEKIPECNVTRELISVIHGTKSNKEKLAYLLHKENKREMKVIDRDKTVKLFRGIIEDVETICRNIGNFPSFALPKKLYEEYVNSKFVVAKIIKNICERLSISSSEEYKYFRNKNKHRLPSYEFILNGGIEEIKNLDTFLSLQENDDEN